MLVAGGALLAYGLARARDVSGIVDQVQVVAFGAFGVLVGVVLVLPAVVRPAVRALGAPLRRFGPPGALARANAMRNPRRTAITASALVIGLALVGLTATFGASARASVGQSTAAGLRADYVVKSDGFAGFSTEVVDRLRDIPVVTTAASMRFADGAVDGDVKTVGSLDPTLLTKVVDLGVLRGDAAALDDAGVLVSDELARHAGVDVGDQLPVQFSRGAGAPRRAGDLPAAELHRALRPVGAAAGGARDHRRRRRRHAAGLPRAGADRRRARRSRTSERSQQALAEDFPNIDVLTRAQFQRRSAGAGRPVPHRAHRDPRAVGDHRHPRDHQHAGAVGVRADAASSGCCGSSACRGGRCAAWCAGSRW